MPQEVRSKARPYLSPRVIAILSKREGAPKRINITNAVCFFFAVDIFLVIGQFVYFLFLYYNRKPSWGKVEISKTAGVGVHGVAMATAVLTSVCAILAVRNVCAPCSASARLVALLDLLFVTALNLGCVVLFVMTAVAVHKYESAKEWKTLAGSLRRPPGLQAESPPLPPQTDRCFYLEPPPSWSDYVCGANNRTYVNRTEAECHGQAVECEGRCPCPDGRMVLIPGYVVYTVYPIYAVCEWCFATSIEEPSKKGAGRREKSRPAAPPPPSLPRGGIATGGKPPGKTAGTKRRERRTARQQSKATSSYWALTVPTTEPSTQAATPKSPATLSLPDRRAPPPRKGPVPTTTMRKLTLPDKPTQRGGKGQNHVAAEKAKTVNFPNKESPVTQKPTMPATITLPEKKM